MAVDHVNDTQQFSLYILFIVVSLYNFFTESLRNDADHGNGNATNKNTICQKRKSC